MFLFIRITCTNIAQLRLGHGWVIALLVFQWIQPLIHALTSKVVWFMAWTINYIVLRGWNCHPCHNHDNDLAYICISGPMKNSVPCQDSPWTYHPSIFEKDGYVDHWAWSLANVFFNIMYLASVIFSIVLQYDYNVLNIASLLKRANCVANFCLRKCYCIHWTGRVYPIFRRLICPKVL